MKMVLGDYYICSDSRQLILKSKQTFLVKRKDINGNIIEVEQRKVYGYFSTLPMLLKNIEKQIIYDNDDIQIICQKLDELNKNINELNNIFSQIITEDFSDKEQIDSIEEIEDNGMEWSSSEDDRQI